MMNRLALQLAIHQVNYANVLRQQLIHLDLFRVEKRALHFQDGKCCIRLNRSQCELSRNIYVFSWLEDSGEVWITAVDALTKGLQTLSSCDTQRRGIRNYMAVIIQPPINNGLANVFAVENAQRAGTAGNANVGGLVIEDTA